MSLVLFEILLALLTLATAAAGFVNAQYATLLWVLAGVFAVATITVWWWERTHKQPRDRHASQIGRASGPHSPVTNAGRDATVLSSGRDIIFHAAPSASGDLTLEEIIERGRVPGRVFVPLTPASLVGLYKAHTSVEADHLMTDLIGKWIPVKAQITDVIGRDWGRYVQVRAHSSPAATLGILVGLSFRGAAAESIVGLGREFEISAVGQIRDADATVVHLDNCEFVSARRMPEITK
jgi:hypothetical protein